MVWQQVYSPFGNTFISTLLAAVTAAIPIGLGFSPLPALGLTAEINMNDDLFERA